MHIQIAMRSAYNKLAAHKLANLLRVFQWSLFHQLHCVMLHVLCSYSRHPALLHTLSARCCLLQLFLGNLQIQLQDSVVDCCCSKLQSALDVSQSTTLKMDEQQNIVLRSFTKYHLLFEVLTSGAVIETEYSFVVLLLESVMFVSETWMPGGADPHICYHVWIIHILCTLKSQA